MFADSNELLIERLNYLQCVADSSRDQSQNNPFKEDDSRSPNYSRCTSPTTTFSEITPHKTLYEIGRNKAIISAIKRIRKLQIK